MPTHERVTVTLPAEVVRDIDRHEKNRSKFVLTAVRRELQRRSRERLRQSLRNPHPAEELIDHGLDEWASSLPDEVSPLVDAKAGKAVRWVPGKGWLEARK